MAGNTATLGSISTAWKGRTGAPKSGTYTGSGNGSTTAFNIAHGVGGTPPTGRNSWGLVPLTEASLARHTVTANGTNLIVTFAVAPPTGTNNLSFRWNANSLS